MKKVFFLFAMCSGLTVSSQQVIELYQGTPPNSIAVPDKERISKPGQGRPFLINVTRPTITVFVPAKQNPAVTSVIICPGGGYGRLSIEDGGYEVGKAFAASGITAFVLKYRTWQDSTYTDFKNIPLQDLQQAIKLIMADARKWNLDTNKIGLLGLSAGGHLVAMSATRGGIKKPAFTVLVYPVISFTDELTSKTSSSRSTLLGKNISDIEKKLFSPELHITPSTPPAFLIHAANDSTSLVGNSIAYYNGLVENKVPAQMLLYQKGGHGFALYNKEQDEYWMPAVIKWLALNGFYKTETEKK